ncbi:MAG: 3 beta-hydroxysteroid dehydrogenase/Delta 5--_4-isomerase, partial [Verrucomicrobiales bacterium]|nr:3 beta-hydroxysteroid dehydrogenase/Delta 5-->4-isomerase [Verrucomicrobiales bacterium]
MSSSRRSTVTGASISSTALRVICRSRILTICLESRGSKQRALNTTLVRIFFPSLGSGVVPDIFSRMNVPGKHRVLVTGSAGRIGKAAVAALVARGHFVRGLDRILSPGASESIAGDIGDWETVDKAVDHVDTIIHLAATPDDDDFMTKLLPNNIIPVHHILESAKAHKVQRVILASTGQVNWHHHFKGP